ncbi:type V toxin-antitoxin system endoribonuclease antitoxin GhoS [Paraburkholderia sp. SOS3]|uniref:type V toxin-antitoxin system endoribonuclease antitoxin GhoS n=1 Tax=Paraburkholderia sp. SOS3 TaxID=1926494 RepID=UPI0009475513|nr:type V toxin-antitoxin system endoribonuclease antitoxin GhoS [Paraburkholderia sp. SOS3]APR40015.1 hypothetical protein BTO02_33275 [Paraburkholderia sp. SOS3]
MESFLVRVELHGAADDDYEALHVQMAVFGFWRTITDTKGVTYELPPATYWGQSQYGTSRVVDFAHAACSIVGRRASIVASLTADTWFNGLKRV